MKTEGYVNQVIEMLQQKMEDRIEGLMKQIGEHPGQVAVSAERQLKAYKELTPGDLDELEKRHGPEKVGHYVFEMERRLRRRKDGGVTA